MIARWDGWQIDVPARRLTGPEGPVHTEPQVFDVLAFLIDHRDRVVPKNEILDEVWGDQFVSESALTSRIKSARRAIGDDGRTQRYIRNVHGLGYQFIGELEADPVPAIRVRESEAPDLALAIGLDDEFPFVGREEEIAAAKAILGGAGASMVLIGGEPGIGKTRLAVEVITSPESDDNLVCAARCEEYVSAPLQPIRDAVGQLADIDPNGFRRWAEGFERQLVTLVPSLARHLDESPIDVDGYSALEVLSTVIERADTGRRLVMLIDDIHWSDEPTRAFLSRAGRRSRDRSLSIVCTYRTTAGDLPSEVADWLQSEARRAQVVRIELDPLDESSARSLVTTVLGPETDAEGLLERSGGHGLFLTESIRDVLTGGNSRSSVTQMVLARLNRLDEPVQDLVRAGAFLGPEFSFSVAAAAAELDPATGLEAADRAVAAELLHETSSPERFRFSHQLVPTAIRSSLTKAGAAVIHQRCADALEAAGATAVEIAHHILGSVPLTPLGEAVGRARRVARQATEDKQFDNAMRLYEEMLNRDLDPRLRAELLLDLGRTGNTAGRVGRMAPRFEEAAELARRNGWTDILVEAALGHFGASPYRSLRASGTLALLAEADDALGEEVSPAKARVLAKTAVFSQFRLPLDARDEMTERALRMAPDATPFERMELLEYRAIVFSNPAGVERLEPIDRELNDLRNRFAVYHSDAAGAETRLLMLAMGDEFRAEAEADSARIRSQPIAEWRDLTLHSTLAGFEGDLETASRLCDEAGSIGDQYWGDSAPYLHALGQVFVAALGGPWDRAIELIEELLERDATQLLTIHGAWAHLAGGDPTRGAQLARSIQPARLGWFREHIMGGNALIAAAEVALLLDDDDLAEVATECLAPFAHLMLGVPWACSLAAADPLSRLAARRGDDGAAAGHTATARRVYHDLDAPALLSRIG